ncbi:MAG: alpha-L-fucosidase [Acidobacteriaceae bacterium]|nr:alpha-L-fucosidase [Acidobacteriaceae bacterium]
MTSTPRNRSPERSDRVRTGRPITRRSALSLLGTAAAAARQSSKPLFQPTWESLKQYRCPEWFAEAKFGIWAHWGPQGAPRQGDWYARNMYIQDTRQYKFHVEHYGHPSKVGYKNVIPLWKAEHWEPETLIARYRRAGAKYFVALGVHCDNFDCWNSKHHRWNAVNFGPKRDVVGTWRDVARRNGLRFGVTEHLGWTWNWFNVNKNSDKTGPMAGVPYDGNDPKYQDLYLPPHPGDMASYPVNATEHWKQQWLSRIKDLIDQHRPDLVYTDGGAFDQVGLDLISHYYNANIAWHAGRLEGVYTLKNHNVKPRIYGDYEEGACTLEVERGMVPDIHPTPWQTDTCIGQWFYFDGFPYKTPAQVTHQLVDIVSKNGNMLLNFPLQPDGTLDSKEESILDEITKWMRIHAEAIFATRPWKVFGEGPSTAATKDIDERKMKPFTADTLRFTSKEGKLFIFCLGSPQSSITVRSLAQTAGLWTKKISHIRLLGSDERVEWSLDSSALHIAPLRQQPSPYTVAFELS